MNSWTDKHWEYKIEALSEQLELLKIIENTLENITEYTNEMLIAPANI